jgi:hypothetical protein
MAHHVISLPRSKCVAFGEKQTSTTFIGINHLGVLGGITRFHCGDGLSRCSHDTGGSTACLMGPKSKFFPSRRSSAKACFGS